MMSTLSRITGYGVGSAKIQITPPAIIANRNPTSNDFRFPLSQEWLNEETNGVFKLSSVRSNSAVWTQLGIVDSYPITPYVVGPTGQAGYQTIQSAIDAANDAGGGMVYVQFGTYTENLTFYSGIQLFGDSEQGTFIVGTHTPPASGTLNIYRVTLQSPTAIFSSNAAGSTTIIVEDCTCNVTNGYTFNLPNWTGAIAVGDIGISGANDGFFNNTGGAAFFIFDASAGSG